MNANTDAESHSRTFNANGNTFTDVRFESATFSAAPVQVERPIEWTDPFGTAMVTWPVVVMIALFGEHLWPADLGLGQQILRGTVGAFLWLGFLTLAMWVPVKKGRAATGEGE